MRTTRESLLLAVRDPGNGSAWSRFYDLYAPMLFAFARRQGLDHHDAEEVRDRCLAALARKMPEFDYRPERGRFHGFLYGIALGHVRDLRRRARVRVRQAASPVSDVADPHSHPAEAWEQSWRQEQLRWALARATAAVSRRDALVFARLLDGEDPEALGRQLGLRRNHVYKIKSQVLGRVRRLLAQLDG